MAGLRGLHGDLRRIQVADFADHDHVRILTQDRAQTAGEGHLDTQVDLGLADAVDVVLDRVLDRHDVAAAVIQRRQGGVQRGGLARAGRAGHQHDAVRAIDDAFQCGGLLGVDAELFEIEAFGLLVENTHDHTLGVGAGRDRRHTHIDLAPTERARDAAILRQALLGNVELGHDLDARDDLRRQRTRRVQHLPEHAVDAEAHGDARLESLDMDVGGVLLDRFDEQAVDELDDRRVVVGFEQVLRFGERGGQTVDVGIVLFEAFGEGGTRAGLAFVGALQKCVEFIERDPFHAHRTTHETTRFLDRVKADAGPADQFDDIAEISGNDQPVPFCERERRSAQELRAGLHIHDGQGVGGLAPGGISREPGPCAAGAAAFGSLSDGVAGRTCFS